jgi:hypothetical protein
MDKATSRLVHGDAGATEFEGMAASMHKTPQALRLYVKRSEAQRVSAARKRRALVEGSQKKNG